MDHLRIGGSNNGGNKDSLFHHQTKRNTTHQMIMGMDDVDIRFNQEYISLSKNIRYYAYIMIQT